MKRRVLSMVLALCLTLCMVPLSARADTYYTASEKCVELIKKFEDFFEYPYEDYGQYSVGYGTRCTGEDLERYTREGITKEEATKLLKEFIASFEAPLNRFAQKHDLRWSQNQFDALLSFTYNVGTSWMTDLNGLVTRAVINGTTGNEFIFAMTMWCTAGGQVLPGLITRRLCEANLYLNNVYSDKVPGNYAYVTYDYSTSLYNGEPRTVRVQGYDTTLDTEVYPTAVQEGYRYLGW